MLQLEEELSDADIRKLRHHHKHFKVDVANYKEIKQEAEVNKHYESDSSENSSGGTKAKKLNKK